ncbi:component of SufBCD complex [Pseudooceanicola aestuarii]|uniref:component of SufBCD complex n=1 Tax=Pseudooceanicola aestuarii TaxID=2697319 RepID=UPI0013D2E5E4|nr:component of SufBCD complex [Pseudooceanicola aestuarii]
MNISTSIFELIDLRSFSNLWFWIALAVVWSSASHWVLGVPYDLVLRARRHRGRFEDDLIDLVRINVTRLLYAAEVSGLIMVGLGSFVLTMLVALGFFYDVEFAQALFLLMLPLSLVALMSVRTARQIRLEDPDPETLYKRLHRHRMAVQGIGVLAILITAMWGMYQNATLGVLG